MSDENLRKLIRLYVAAIRILWAAAWLWFAVCMIIFFIPSGSPSALPALAQISSAEKLEWMMDGIYCFVFGLAMMAMNWFFYWLTSPAENRPQINQFPLPY